MFSGGGPKSSRDRASRCQEAVGTWYRTRLSQSSAEKHFRRRNEYFNAEPISKRTSVCWICSEHFGPRRANSRRNWSPKQTMFPQQELSGTGSADFGLRIALLGIPAFSPQHHGYSPAAGDHQKVPPRRNR